MRLPRYLRIGVPLAFSRTISHKMTLSEIFELRWRHHLRHTKLRPVRMVGLDVRDFQSPPLKEQSLIYTALVTWNKPSTMAQNVACMYNSAASMNTTYLVLRRAPASGKFFYTVIALNQKPLLRNADHGQTFPGHCRMWMFMFKHTIYSIFLLLLLLISELKFFFNFSQPPGSTKE